MAALVQMSLARRASAATRIWSGHLLSRQWRSCRAYRHAPALAGANPGSLYACGGFGCRDPAEPIFSDSTVTPAASSMVEGGALPGTPAISTTLVLAILYLTGVTGLLAHWTAELWSLRLFRARESFDQSGLVGPAR